MAFSASRARLLIHDFFLCPKLYYNPLFRSSSSEKVIVVSFFLSQSNEKQEENTIMQILSNKKYDPSILNKIKHKKQKPKQNDKNHRWAKFTYTGRETLFITKIFKKANIKTAFSTNNTVEKLLSKKPEQTTNIYMTSQEYTS